MIAIILGYLAIQSAIPNIERNIYWGEIALALIVAAGLRLRYVFPGRYRPYILAGLYFSLVLPLVELYIGHGTQDFSWSMAIRHASYFVYAIFFLFSFAYARQIVGYVRRRLYVFCLASLLIANLIFSDAPIGGAGLIGLIMVGLFARRKLKLSYSILLMSLLALFPSGTNMLIFICYFFLMVFVLVTRNFSYQGLRRTINAAGLMVILFVGLFYGAISNVASSIIDNNQLAFVDVQSEFGDMQDVNDVWRLAWWGAIISRFPDHPLGEGIGTPIVPIGSITVLTLGGAKTRDTAEYVVAGHNFFVTYLARCGIFFLLPFLYFIYAIRINILNTIYFVGRHEEGRLVFASFIFAMIMVLSASFNVVLESPLYAASFWLAVGLWLRLSTDISVKREVTAMANARPVVQQE